MAMRSERAAGLIPLVLLAVLAACGAPDRRQPVSCTGEVGGQTASPQWTLQNGRPVPMDTRQSRIELRVYRGGRLARLGHNHVIEVRELRGGLKITRQGAGIAQLGFDVARMIVDDPAARARAGAEFDSRPGAKAVEGTRRNMLGERVLDAANWPQVTIAARIADMAAKEPLARLHLGVRGVGCLYEVPVEITRERDEIRVTGTLPLRQSDFGIEPFAVLAGALQVRDEFEAEFLIVGHVSGAAM